MKSHSLLGDAVSCALFAGTIAVAGLMAVSHPAPAQGAAAQTPAAVAGTMEIVVTKRRVAPECFERGASPTLAAWCRDARETPVSLEIVSPRA
jgi:hypothetical protein